MPDTPLSQLPGFIPAAQPGTPAFKAFVAVAFSTPTANTAFAQHVSRLATHSEHSTPVHQPASGKAAANHA